VNPATCKMKLVIPQRCPVDANKNDESIKEVLGELQLLQCSKSEIKQQDIRASPFLSLSAVALKFIL